MERRFSEEQVSEVLRRAAELSGEGAPGLSESELRRIATEIGLPAGAVDAAMREAGAVASSASGRDTSFDRVIERQVEGELGEEAVSSVEEHFVPEWPFDRRTKRASMVSYRSMVGINSCHVSVSQRAGKTSLKVTTNSWLVMVATYLPALLLSVFAGVMAFGVWQAPQETKILSFGLVTAVLFGAAVVSSLALVRFSNRKVERLADAAAVGLAETSGHALTRAAATTREDGAQPLEERLR